MEFQIIKTNSKEHTSRYGWRIVTSIGDILASSHDYSSYDDCVADIDYVAINSFSATIRDLADDPAVLLPPEETGQD